jgi:Flp pilus assembly protein TadG
MMKLTAGASLPRWLRPLVSLRAGFRSDGAAIIEFAVASAVLVPVLFGIIEMCLAFYSFNFVAEAAREATRYAAVRGSTSCLLTPGLADCNLNTSGSLQTYVRGLGLPGANNVTVTASWLTASATTPTTWTACATAPCNVPGNEVKVFVSYTLPLAIPFARTRFSFGSTSEMVISQ